MRIILILLIFVAAGCPGNKSDCNPELNEGYIDSAEIIVAAIISEKSEDLKEFTVAKPVKIFKGSVNRELIIDASNTDLVLEAGREYLIYASRGESNNLLIEQCSRTGLLEERRSDTKFLTEHIDCMNPPANKNVACIQIYEPVCGCDNKTYGNSCEARSQGINIYTMGECE